MFIVRWGYNLTSNFLLDLISSQLGRVVKGDFDVYARQTKIQNDYEQKHGKNSRDFHDENLCANKLFINATYDLNWQKEHTKVQDLLDLYDICQARTEQNWNDLEEGLK